MAYGDISLEHHTVPRIKRVDTDLFIKSLITGSKNKNISMSMDSHFAQRAKSHMKQSREFGKSAYYDVIPVVLADDDTPPMITSDMCGRDLAQNKGGKEIMSEVKVDKRLPQMRRTQEQDNFHLPFNNEFGKPGKINVEEEITEITSDGSHRHIRRVVSHKDDESLWKRHSDAGKWAKTIMVSILLALLILTILKSVHEAVVLTTEADLLRVRQSIKTAQHKYELNLCHLGPPVDLIDRCKELDVERLKSTASSPVLNAAIRVLAQSVRILFEECLNNLYILITALVVLFLVLKFK